MKKILIVLFLAIVLNAEVKTKEAREDCIRYLTKADELMVISVVRNENELDSGIIQVSVLKTISTSLVVANLQNRYSICMKKIKSIE